MNQISFEDLFIEENKVINEIQEPSPLQREIIALLESGETSALQICEKLMKLGKISCERFSTTKPRDYGQVCSWLDTFVSQGILLLVEDKDKQDRIYKLIK
ncbi:DUF3895 domain-containing protein [Bacillus cihuensis]|uniref:DUF3895 domain-containing protein n=1 Tax=Bacillus cihuensis TaxID=1208599 RepID=UPI0004905F83|nr:DUF3895 domain-containing protein [Bacillus cihuensis]